MSPAAGAAGKAAHPRISPKHRPIPHDSQKAQQEMLQLLRLVQLKCF